MGLRTRRSKELDPLEDLKRQIKTYGPPKCPEYLEFLRNSQRLSKFENCTDDHIAAIVYHPRIASDCEYSAPDLESPNSMLTI